MPKSNHRGIVIGLVAVIALLLSVTVPTALADDDQEQEFDMNDRFATEDGASGSGEIEVDGDIVEIEVEAEGLLPNHQYEMKVTIGPAFEPFAPTNVVTCGPVTSEDDGEVEIECDLDLVQLLEPGAYRVDLFVTHIHPTVEGEGEVGVLLTALFNRDPLLSCQPAPVVVVPGDD